MAGVLRYNGIAEEGAIFSYPPVAVRIACTGGFLVNGTGADGEIVENGYEKAVKTLALTGRIIWLGSQGNDVFSAIVEGNVFPDDADSITALIAAITAVRDGANTVTITTATVLLGTGAFDYA